MLNKNVLKTVGSIAVGAFEIVSTVVVAGLVVASKSNYKHTATYNEAINAVAGGDLYYSDKAKVINAIKPNFKPVVYEAIVEVVKADMYYSDKAETIINMCKQAEESI